MTSSVIGRFAPSPTGPLHFGSVVAALASYLNAKKQNGKWYVRMDDLDQPRNIDGADSLILKTLEALGLYWDGEILYQSTRFSAYQDILDELDAKNLTYRCICTRKQLQGAPYPGYCRNNDIDIDQQHAIRLLTNQEPIIVQDQIQGQYQQNLELEVGDFIVRRSDNLTAYHIAVVADDEFQGVTEIVRGLDLLDSTPRQIYLQKLLVYKSPLYAHIPVAVNEQGKKLSKQHHAKPINNDLAAHTLIEAMIFLGLSPEPCLAEGSTSEILDWAIQHWSIESVPKVREIQVQENSS